MVTRHGGPIVVVAVLVGMATAALAYYLSNNLATAFGAMVIALALCANFFSNWSGSPRASSSSSVSEGANLTSKPSSLAFLSLGFVTLGSLLMVWGGTWYCYLDNNPPQGVSAWYFCLGVWWTGVAVLLIGLTTGHIGRAARTSELPPPEVTPAVRQVEQASAARYPAAIPVQAPAAATPGHQQRVTPSK